MRVHQLGFKFGIKFDAMLLSQFEEPYVLSSTNWETYKTMNRIFVRSIALIVMIFRIIPAITISVTWLHTFHENCSIVVSGGYTYIHYALCAIISSNIRQYW